MDPTQTPPERLTELLNRPPAERAREHRYRFAQSLVFGLPVLALEVFGPRLGGPESHRWVGLMQALLAGWVWYVAAAGMLFEGMILLRRGRLTGDFLVAFAATGLYLWSLLVWIILLTAWLAPRAAMYFAPVIILLAGWTGIQYLRLRSHENPPTAR